MWRAAGGRGGGGVFESSYRVYPVSFIDKTQLENGDKVILPPSALDRLASLRIDYPMLFQISNPREKKTSHCGVLEFVADEGHAYIPYWMMQNLLLTEGDLVKFRSISLAKGTYVKLRPHTSDFLDISNPKAVLEMTLRNYSCLTKNDTILVNYNNKRYFIDIVETQPGDAITIIETDCEVDFAPPLDYDETQFKAAAAKKTKTEAAAKGASEGAAGGKEEEEASEEAQPSFIPFAGKGNRLDGKAQTSAPIAIPSPTAASSSASAGASSLGKSGSLGKRASGKLVFGRDATGKSVNPDLPKPPPLNTARGMRTGGAGAGAGGSSKKAEEKKEEQAPKFQAFSGKSYKLT